VDRGVIAGTLGIRLVTEQAVRGTRTEPSNFHLFKEENCYVEAEWLHLSGKINFKIQGVRVRGIQKYMLMF
jgi:hypothetical protein